MDIAFRRAHEVVLDTRATLSSSSRNHLKVIETVSAVCLSVCIRIFSYLLSPPPTCSWRYRCRCRRRLQSRHSCAPGRSGPVTCPAASRSLCSTPSLALFALSYSKWKLGGAEGGIGGYCSAEQETRCAGGYVRGRTRRDVPRYRRA